jgi:hypothetical protein
MYSYRKNALHVSSKTAPLVSRMTRISLRCIGVRLIGILET